MNFSSTSITTPVTSVLTNTTPSISGDEEKSANDNSVNNNVNSIINGIGSSVNAKDNMFTTSVAELRRKAQEHSAALWQSLQQIQQQSNGESAAAGMPNRPELPPFSSPDVTKDVEKSPKN